MVDAVTFQYAPVTNALGEVALRPLLQLTLTHGEQTIQASGLVDTGADVNVLPYELGIALGVRWDQARTGLKLSGNLANFEARGLLLTGAIRNMPPVRLAFAWTRAERVPLLLGQVNFLAEFDVCFFGARRLFEVRPKYE